VACVLYDCGLTFLRVDSGDTLVVVGYVQFAVFSLSRKGRTGGFASKLVFLVLGWLRLPRIGRVSSAWLGEWASLVADQCGGKGFDYIPIRRGNRVRTVLT
jgi:hypothetical protein